MPRKIRARGRRVKAEVFPGERKDQSGVEFCVFIFQEEMKMSGFPTIEGVDSWIDTGRTNESSCELMVSIPPPLGKGYVRKGFFWLEFSNPQNGIFGWMKFTHLINLKNRGVFVASEWRPVADQAPARQDMLLPSLVPLQTGSEHIQYLED